MGPGHFSRQSLGRLALSRSFFRAVRAPLALTVVSLWFCIVGTSGAAAAAAAFTQVPGSPFKASGIPLGAVGVAFSPSGRLLATGNNMASSVSVFAVPSSGVLTQVVGSPFGSGSAASIAFSPAGGFMAAANNGQQSVAMFSVNQSTGVLTPVAGSPFATSDPDPEAVAFSPAGGFLAVANASGSVSIFSVNQSTGALAQVAGSPFTAGSGSGVFSVAFSPDGAFLAAADTNDAAVSLFSVNQSTGALTEAPSSPFPTGPGPRSVVFSPSGAYLATANNLEGTVSVFAVDETHETLTEIAPSPFPAGFGPASVTFSPNGDLLAVTSSPDDIMSVFGVNQSTGALAALPGSPFSTGSSPGAVTFSPNGELLANADSGDGTVAVFTTVSAAITSPANGGFYALGQAVGTNFACADPYGSGIRTCIDSNGAVGPSGRLDTSALGSHSYTVTATSNVGQTATKSIGYTVAAPPTARITAPSGGGTYTQGEVVVTSFTCAEGTYGPGVKSCTDSNGVSGPVGHLDTSTVGSHTYVVTALSSDGQSGTASVTYLITPPPPTSAQIKASLLKQLIPSGKSARIAALLKSGRYILRFSTLTAGQLLIRWYYLPKGAHLTKGRPRPKPVLIASGSVRFSGAGPTKLIIRLTAAGRRMLRATKRLTLTATATYTPRGRPVVKATKKFTLRR